MRLLLASVATLAAVAFAAPAFAQDAATPAPTPTTTSKPKHGTTAYCNTLKSSSSKSSCLKRVHAQAATPKTPGGSTSHKKGSKKPTSAPSIDSSASAAPAAPTSAPSPSGPGSVNVPPLPQKTI